MRNRGRGHAGPRGCGGDDGDDEDSAQTLPDATGAVTATESTPAADRGALLTPEQAQGALPVVTDLPTGWADDPENTATGDDSEEDEISPAEMRHRLRQPRLAEPRCARKSGEVVHTREFGPFLGVEVLSWKPRDQPGEDDIQAVLDTLAQCPMFTTTDAEGTTSSVTATGLSFPQMGDATMALRLNIENDIVAAMADLVFVVVDKNGVAVTGFGIGAPPDPAGHGAGHAADTCERRGGRLDAGAD